MNKTLKIILIVLGVLIGVPFIFGLVMSVLAATMGA